MGFDENESREALRQCYNDLNAAANRLLSSWIYVVCWKHVDRERLFSNMSYLDELDSHIERVYIIWYEYND